MKTLNLHCDYITFKPLKKAIKTIPDLSEIEKKSKHVEEVLVVFVAVEKSDKNIQEVVSKLVEDVREISKKIKAQKVVLYPYAHLSKELANPNLAIEVLKKAEENLKNYFEVTRAPFGYYKEFEMKVKGHPLSELSRDFKTFREENYEPEKLLREISKSKLDSSKLKENDHRIIGQQMDLFSFSEVAPGMVFWHNNGLIIFNELIKFWREVHRDEGYQEIKTPQVLDSKLWKISGHWKLYKENMFITDYEKREFAVKPMNCPGGMIVYKNRPKSYKDLPIKMAELGTVHRKELSGTLGGLFRLIQFTQDDAHIFCTKKQLEEEISKVIKLFKLILDKFNFKYRFTLSTRSEEKKEKYLGDDKIWDLTENAIKKAAKKLKVNFDETPGEAKFYGPSFDVQIKDSLNREWQCSTIQLDMQLPERFKLEYTDKENKKRRPIMLHRVVYGAIERFLGILIEHTKGRLPVWLSPIQVRVLSFTQDNRVYATKIFEELEKKIPELRIESDFKDNPLSSKIRDAELKKIPYIIVIGGKEEKNKILSVRKNGEKKIEEISMRNFSERLSREIKNRE